MNKILFIVIGLLILTIFPIAQSPQDKNLKSLLSKYLFSQEKIRQAYKTLGYTIIRLEKDYGEELLAVLDDDIVDMLLILTYKPTPFEELYKGFSLKESIRITMYLIEFPEDYVKYKEKIQQILKTCQDNSVLYTSDSPLEITLSRHDYYPQTIIGNIWEPNKKKKCIEKLLSLTSAQRKMILQFPPALPFLLVTGDRGLQAISREGISFLYFISFFNSSYWPKLTEHFLQNGNCLSNLIQIYGVSIYYYWVQNPFLLDILDLLLDIYKDEKPSVTSFRKAVEFLATNKETLEKYQDDRNFLEKTKEILCFFKTISVDNEQNFSLLDISCKEKYLFRLVYEYPESREFLRRFPNYKVTALFYEGKIKPHIFFLLNILSNRSPEYSQIVLERGIIPYYNNEQFCKIIARFKEKGMMVAIYKNPNDYWVEILGEEEKYLNNYYILPDGKIQYKQKNSSLWLELIPCKDLWNTSTRLCKGYKVEPEDYLNAGLDILGVVLNVTGSLIKYQMKGNTTAIKILKENLKKAIKEQTKEKIKAEIIKKSKELLKKRNMQKCIEKLKDTLETVQISETAKYIIETDETNENEILISSDREYLETMQKNIDDYCISNAEKQSYVTFQDFRNDPELQNFLAKALFSKSIPSQLKKYTFLSYKHDMSQSPLSLEVLLLTSYMMSNVIQ